MSDLDDLKTAWNKENNVPTVGKEAVAAKKSSDGNPIMKFIKSMVSPTSGPSTFQDRVMQSITFGGMDNLISAATAAGKAPFSDKTFGEVYSEDQATYQKEREAQNEAHPVAAGAGSVVGALVGPDPTAKLKLIGKGGQVAKSVLSGAVSAGAQSFGEADEADLMGRLEAAANGFVTGGLTGGLLGTAGSTLSKALETKATNNMQKALSSMRAETNRAHKAVEDAKEIIPGNVLSTNINDAATTIRSSYFYDPTSDAAKPIEAMLKKIDERVNVPTTNGSIKPVDMTLGELELMRRDAWKVYKTNKNPDIIKIIKSIDKTMDDAAANGSDLMKAARASSRMEQNTRMFDEIMKKAGRQAKAGTGDTASRFKYAAEKILDNKKYSEFLNEDERAALQSIIDGTTTGNVNRFIGRFAPSSGNLASLIGMMTMFHNPALAVPAMVGAHAARGASNRSTSNLVSEARRVISGSPTAKPAPQLGPVAAKTVGQTAVPQMPSLLETMGVTQPSQAANSTLMELQNIWNMQQQQQSQ